jgi:ATP-binding cassette, subfamily C (CFTR/MRP), member 1
VNFNNRLLDDSQRPAYLLAMIQRWLTFVLYLVVAAMAILVVVLTTQVRLITGTGFAGASLVTLMSFGDIVSQLIMMYTQLETSIGAVSRLKSFSEKVLPESLSGEDIEPLESWPPRGAIEISGVSASYE